VIDMRRFRQSWCLWVWSGLVLSLGPDVARAQTAPVSRALTLDEAVQMAVAASPRLAEATARTTAATSSVGALKALAYPTASVLAQYARQNNITEFLIPDGQGGSRVLYPNIVNMFKARAEVSVPIYSFGRVASNVAAAEAEVQAADADRRAVEAQVRLDTMRAYWTLATAREAARVLTESLARADAWVGDVRAREAAGVLPPSDVLSAQAQRARQYVRLLQARNEAAVAELDLARLIGVPAGSSLQIASPVDRALPRASEAAGTRVEDLVSGALTRRAERAGMTARGDGLRQSAEATLANLNPYATAQAWFEEAKPNTRYIPPVNEWRDSWMLDVRFVWPLFDSGRTKKQAATFVAQAGAIDARRLEFDSLVALEVRQRVLDVEYSRAAIDASGEAVAAAAEARRVVEERFRAGVATSTDVLDAQVALLEAELERTRLTAGLRLAEARLLFAIGEQ
jgi:outer membrane protein TolC